MRNEHRGRAPANIADLFDRHALRIGAVLHHAVASLAEHETVNTTPAGVLGEVAGKMLVHDQYLLRRVGEAPEWVEAAVRMTAALGVVAGWLPPAATAAGPRLGAGHVTTTVRTRSESEEYR